jgi:hypothetical protein
MKRIFAAAAIAVTILPGTAKAAGQNAPNPAAERYAASARYLLNSCQTWVSKAPEGFEQGYCLGEMVGLRALVEYSISKGMSAICLPANATLGTMVTVVTFYLTAHPERLDENGVDEALMALRQFWPCK